MRALIVVLALFLSAPFAWSDTVATWQLGDGTLSTLSIRDDQHIRIDTNEKDTYMLLIDRKVYLVHQENGQWSAVDMDQMAGLLKNFSKGTDSSSSQNFRQKFRNTGRSETIAGYKGKVFEVETTDGTGKTKKDEIVLSSHPDIKKIQQGWVVFGGRMARMLGPDSARELEQSLKSAEMKEHGGMLRYGKDMRLQKVEKPSLDLATYQLPPGVTMTGIPDMGKMPARGEPSPAQKEADGFLKDTTDKAGDAAKDQTQDSIVEGVREGVKGVFKKLW